MGTNQINTHVSIEPSNTLVNTDQPNNLAKVVKPLPSVLHIL